MSIPPFKTQPFFQSRPWGGRAMASKLGKALPEGPVAESWEVSTHPNGVCRISGGPMNGRSLADLVHEAGQEILGREVFARYGGEFPLLVKLIDVNALASVQVHPNDEQARQLEGYPRGKTEAWYIIERSPQAVFYLGAVPGVTADMFRKALSGGDARTLLCSPEVAAGDCLFVPPGTLHAAGNGVLLLEIQQSSDITYRVYDWDRMDAQGNKRELHVEKALQVIDFHAQPKISRATGKPDALERILASELFQLDEANVRTVVSLPARESFSTGTLIEGNSRLVSGDTALDVRCGDSFVVPAGVEARLEGGPARVIMTFIE
jgi:mannose-6-phosphate isomerase